jgi:uncharacterized protein with NAD-binding domain and iron-sulfur cluster
MTRVQATVDGGISRRRLLRDAAGAGAALALGAAGEPAAAPRRRRPSGPTVAVLGGGVAGLTAAHELAERGFRVTVVEPRALGGKARSIGVPQTARGGRDPLPGEHGFRFFPGFYRNVPDTMRRIPFGRNRDGVAGNLVEPEQVEYAFTGGRRVLLPRSSEAAPGVGTQLAWLDDMGVAAGIPAAERAHFVNRMLVFLTSSEERRLGQWDATSWKDFIVGAGEPVLSDAYGRVLGEALVRGSIAVSASKVSARTIGRVLEAFAYTGMPAVSGYGAPDRILDAPTNEAWIDPWVALLRRRGVRFVRFRAVRALEVRRGRVEAAVLSDPGDRLEADWYVLAIPVERARVLLSRDLLALDPSLEGLRRLETEWMNGIQYFLRRRFREPTVGHTLHVDSPWAVSSINQARFWPRRLLARDYGDGRVREILSVIISDWTTPGTRVRRPASRCTAQQIARETWSQLKAHLGRPGELTDDMLVGWFLDPAIGAPQVPGRRATNDSPLFANTVGALRHRPSPATAIPNLLLAGDHVRTDVDLATMEGANESARRAVNALLERSGSRARPARVYELYRPAEYEQARRDDAERFRLGLPHAMEAAVPQPA